MCCKLIKSELYELIRSFRVKIDDRGLLLIKLEDKAGPLPAGQRADPEAQNTAVKHSPYPGSLSKESH